MKDLIEAIEFFKNLSFSDRTKLKEEFRLIEQHDLEKRISESKNQFEKNREKNTKRKEDSYKRGEIFKTIVKVGDLIKLSGTRDSGYRLVHKLSDLDVVCFQLEYRKKKNPETGKYDVTLKHTNRITEHYWHKVSKILKIEDYTII
jgi:hypothetical protein